MKEIQTTIAEKTTDSKSSIQLLILVNILLFINSLIQKVHILEGQYDGIERLFYPRRYPSFLTKNNIVFKKTLIAGYDNNSLIFTIKTMNDELDELKELVELKVNEFMKKANKIEIENNPSLELLEYSKEVIQEIINQTNKITSDLKVEIPISDSCATNGKRLRKLLTDTQAVARETELLFVYFLKEVLREHGQIRRDYSEIEAQTNQVLDKLYISLGEIHLGAESIGASFRAIIKDLKNIRADLNTLKIVTIFLMRPRPDSPIILRNEMTKILKKGLGEQ